MKLTAEQMANYLRGMAKERGFDDTRTGQLVALVEGDGDVTLSRAELKELLEPVVEHPFGRHAEFARAMDEYKTKYSQLERWKIGVESSISEKDQKIADTQALIQKYEAAYGKLDEATDIGGGKVVTQTGEVLDKKTVETLLATERQTMAREVMAFQLDQNRLTQEFFNRFGKLPDMNRVIQKIAEAAADPVSPKTMSLSDAFNATYGDEIQTYDKKKADEQFEAEVEKRVRQRVGRNAPAPTGANLGEGTFWGHHNAKPAQAGTPAAPPNEDALITSFAADFHEAMSANTTSS